MCSSAQQAAQIQIRGSTCPVVPQPVHEYGPIFRRSIQQSEQPVHAMSRPRMPMLAVVLLALPSATARPHRVGAGVQRAAARPALAAEEDLRCLAKLLTTLVSRCLYGVEATSSRARLPDVLVGPASCTDPDPWQHLPRRPAASARIWADLSALHPAIRTTRARDESAAHAHARGRPPGTAQRNGPTTPRWGRCATRRCTPGAATKTAAGYLILSYLVLSCLLLSYVVFSLFIWYHLVFLCLIVSYSVFAYISLSYLILSRLVCSYLLLSHVVVSWLIWSYLVFSCHILSCSVFACLTLSYIVLACLASSYIVCLIFAYRVLTCLILSCLVLCCLILSYLAISCLVFSALVLSCLILSCLILSYIVDS